MRGARTETISSVCPVCRTRKEWPADHVVVAVWGCLGLRQLCCTARCEALWSVRMLEAYHKAGEPINLIPEELLVPVAEKLANMVKPLCARPAGPRAGG